MDGSLTAAQKTWIADGLDNSEHDLIFMASHHGPHNYAAPQDFFVDADAFDLEAIVDADREAHPNHRVTYLFGHNHIQHVVRRYDNMSPNFPGLLAPALLESNPSAYALLHVFPSGEIVVETRFVNGLAVA